MYRSNVKAHSRGVVIYISDHISSNIVLDLINHQFSESLWVEIRLNKRENLSLEEFIDSS